MLFFISLSVCLALAEFVFRKMIFSKNEAFKNLHNAALYSDYFDDVNYWKLYYLFGGEYKPPANPHPLLGWIGDFDRGTLMHNQIAGAREKR